MKRVILASIAMIAGVAIIDAASVVAAGTSLQQKILPMNCVFETVNDGTSTLRYLTPAECGVVASQPSADGLGLSSQPAGLPGNGGPYEPRRPVFFMPNAANSTDKTANTALRLPWRPIVDVAPQNIEQSPPTTSKLNSKTVVVTLVGVVAIVALLIFVI